MKFLRHQWYTAATSVELGEKPLARVICNEPVVIFRGQDGNVARWMVCWLLAESRVCRVDRFRRQQTAWIDWR